MKSLLLLLSMLFLPQSLSACPEVEDGNSPLVYGIYYASKADGVEDLKKAHDFLQKSVSLNQEHSEEILSLFNTTISLNSAFLSPEESERFLIHTAEMGVGFASYLLASLYSNKESHEKTFTYLKKAAEQDYPPAFFEYASFLKDKLSEEFKKPLHPEYIPIIYKYLSKSIEHKCDMASYSLTQFIHLYIPEKRNEIIPLLLSLINTAASASDIREEAIEDLCVLGVGDVYQMPLEQRWCAKSQSSFMNK